MQKHLIVVSDEGVFMDGKLLRDPGAVYAGAVAAVFLGTFRSVESLTGEPCTRLEVDRERHVIRAMKDEQELASAPLRHEASSLETELAFVKLLDQYIQNASWD